MDIQSDSSSIGAGFVWLKIIELNFRGRIDFRQDGGAHLNPAIVEQEHGYRRGYYIQAVIMQNDAVLIILVITGAGQGKTDIPEVTVIYIDR